MDTAFISNSYVRNIHCMLFKHNVKLKKQRFHFASICITVFTDTEIFIVILKISQQNNR